MCDLENSHITAVHLKQWDHYATPVGHPGGRPATPGPKHGMVAVEVKRLYAQVAALPPPPLPFQTPQVKSSLGSPAKSSGGSAAGKAAMKEFDEGAFTEAGFKEYCGKMYITLKPIHKYPQLDNIKSGFDAIFIGKHCIYCI